MAYATLISLENSINQILDHNLSSISLEDKHQIISLHEYVTPFQAFLENFPDKFNILEGRMREVMNEAEDSLEYLVLEKPEKIYVSSDDDECGYDPSEDDGRKQELELQFEKVMEEVYLIAGEVKVLEKVMEETDLMARGAKEIKQSSNRGDTQHDAESSPGVALNIKTGDIVGAEDDLFAIKSRVCGESHKLQTIPIFGMGGIGKTTLAKNVFDDPLLECFDLCIWVTVSQDYSEEKVFSSLLNSMDLPKETEVSKMAQSVYQHLKGRRYIVVMDDIWSTEVWDDLRSYFPDDNNGSRIILTTRLRDVACYPDPEVHLHEMRLMDEKDSWNLLREKVFTHQNCPPELENIGKEIARRCKGLPLAIVVIAGLLSTVSRNRASWKEIAQHVKDANTTEHRQIEDILSLSYSHLPQCLRPCFLYMASFPEDEVINVSRLIRLWVAEGFVKRRNSSQRLEDEAEECLEDLVKRNLVLVTERKCDGKVKRFILHDLMRDLSIRKAHESKFLLSLMDKNVDKEYFLGKVRNERRVSVDSSSLAYLSRTKASTIHTIRCSRKKFVKFDFFKSTRLLRVLDADVDVNSLRPQLFDLFHLRYLSIRYDYHTPLPWLSLQCLQTLIIHKKHANEFLCGLTYNLLLYWCMPQLRHVYFYGTIRFVDPEGSNSSLENLQTLSYVSHDSCTERILKLIASLKKLKIDCSEGLPPKREVYLNDLVHLHQLESLEIYAGHSYGTRPKYYEFSLPVMLKNLCLRDLRLRWDAMSIVGSLPDLQVLKLKRCICVWSTWETIEGQFPQLEFLLIESLNFENWITESSHFPSLKRLILDYCRHLKRIPNEIGDIPTLNLIEVKGEVKKSLLLSSEEIQKDQEEMGNDTLQVVCINASMSGYESDEFQPNSAADEEKEDDYDGDDIGVSSPHPRSSFASRLMKSSTDEENEDDNDDDDYGGDDIGVSSPRPRSNFASRLMKSSRRAHTSNELTVATKVKPQLRVHLRQLLEHLSSSSTYTTTSSGRSKFIFVNWSNTFRALVSILLQSVFSQDV